MNKTKLLILALCAIALTGCDIHKDHFKSDNTIEDRLSKSMHTVEYNGHSYVVLHFNETANGITHDPNCPCHKKGGDDNGNL